MQVINLNKNGEVIPDLSKVKLPKELNDLVWRIIYRKEDTDDVETAQGHVHTLGKAGVR